MWVPSGCTTSGRIQRAVPNVSDAISAATRSCGGTKLLRKASCFWSTISGLAV